MRSRPKFIVNNVKLPLSTLGLKPICALLLVLLSALLAAPVFSADLTLLIDNYHLADDQKPTGTTLISLYNSKENFAAMNNTVSTIRIKPQSKTVRITFHNLPAGEYAFSLFHDGNDNSKLDTNILGIPSEQYGFSNNAGSFGPAKFSDAKFTLKDDKTVTIHLR